MRPVNHTAAIIPFIAAVQAYVIVFAQRHTLRKINIVRHQHGVAAVECQYKTLVTVTVIIIGQ